MTTDVVTIAADAPLSAALNQMITRRIGSVLVHDSGALAGIVTCHDLIAAAAHKTRLTAPVAVVMTRSVLRLPAQTLLVSAYGRMRRTGVRHLVVTGRDGAPAGIVSESDFFLHLSTAQLIGTLTVADVMDTSPARLDPDATMAETLAAVAASPLGSVIITRAARPLVILTEGELMTWLRGCADPTGLRLGDQLKTVAALTTIDEGASLPAARDLFLSLDVRILAVVNRQGAATGLLGLRGLIGAALPDRPAARVRTHSVAPPSRVRLRQFQRAVEQSPVSVIITDTEATIEYVNPRFCEVTGYRADEVVGRNPRLLKSGTQDPAFYQALWRTISAGRVWRGELCNRRRDGSLYWESATISPVRDHRGEIVNFVAVKEDVTELHLMRVLLDGRNRVLERLSGGCSLGEVLDAITAYIAEAQPGAIPSVHILDLDRVHLWVGAAPGLPTHYKRAVDGVAVGPWGRAIVEQNIVIYDDILDHPDWVALRDLLLTTGLRACWSQPIYGRSGRVLGTLAMYYRETHRPMEREQQLIASAADLAAMVLEHFQTQAALRHAEERERLLLLSTTEGVIGVDRQGIATFVNPAAARMLGYRAEELIGAVIHDQIHCPPVGHPNSRAAENHVIAHCPLVAPALDGRARHGIRETLYRCDGSGFPVELWSNPVLLDGDLAGAAVTFRDISERLEQEQRIQFLGFHDTLTGLPNRNLLREALDREIARLRRHDTPFALYLLDLDHFKDVNDSLGHPAGDELLQVMAERLRAQLRAEDSVARMGGDEFAIIQSYTAGVDGVKRLASRVVKALARPVSICGREISVGASLGVVLVNTPLDADTLMAQADLALYQAKDQGRNRYALFQPHMAQALERELEIVGSLSQAIANGDLHLVYQPQMRIGSRTLYAVEALVRWRHRRLGALLPGDFIPILVRRGAIARLDGWVLQQTARQSHDWTRRGCPFGRLAVNLSTLYPDDGLGAATPPELIRRQGGNPQDIELEMTERMLTRETYGVAEAMAAIRGAGMGIAIADFGTGYASLSYLRRCNPRTLKIDRALVADMAADRGAAEMVKAAIALGRALDLTLVAEGVEDNTQADYLLSHGCELAQGYAYGAPMEIDAFDARYFADCAPQEEGGRGEVQPP